MRTIKNFRMVLKPHSQKVSDYPQKSQMTSKTVIFFNQNSHVTKMNEQLNEEQTKV